MNKIINGLFLGGYDDASDSVLLQSHNITHILTVHELKLSRNLRKDFQYMFIETKSTGEIDLLSSFQTTNDFIANGIQSGGVLVHCQLGMSRSSTVVIAFIMSSEKCTVERALDIVKRKRSVTSPSDAFMYQLRLFEHMQFTVDLSYPIYRFFKNFIVVENRLGNAALVLSPVDAAAANYKCRQCRTALFSDGQLNFHLSEEEDVYFQVSCFLDSELDEQRFCSRNRLYVEPMQWMAFGDEATGLVRCPGCRDAVGSFCLAGARCDCGKWVYQAVVVDEARVAK